MVDQEAGIGGTFQSNAAMRRLYDFVIAAYVTIAAIINGYLSIKFWRELFK